MLFMHGGWVRTGTTSLQAALVANREDLAAAGIVYPDRWRLGGRNDNHHGLIELLERGDEPCEFERFRDELRAIAGSGSVLLSAESLTYFLAGAKRETLLSLLAALRGDMPVHVIWTLRNLVDIVTSLYLRQILTLRKSPPTPAEFLRDVTADRDWPGESFAGLRRLEAGVERTTYLGYERGGSHSRELLRVVGVPSEVRVPIEEGLAAEPRLNARLTHKQAVAILRRDQISARLGTAVDRAELADLFYRGEFRFDDDAPCGLFESGALRDLHRRALDAARDTGFAPYLDLFAQDEIDCPAPVEIDADVLGDDDLSRLAAHLDRRAVSQT